MKNNEIEKFVKLLKENDFTDSYDSYLIVNDNDVIYKDQGGWFELKLVNKKEQKYIFKCDTYSDEPYSKIITGEKEFDEFLEEFKELYCFDNTAYDFILDEDDEDEDVEW